MRQIKRPSPLSQSELEAVLKEITDGVISGDTMEGSIEFLIPGPCRIHENSDDPDCKWCQPDTMAVTAMYRVGNAMGQGGYASIGEFVDAPERPPVEVVFTGPPDADPANCGFVEVEIEGESVKLGEWVEREDGYWVLRIQRGELA